jgi:hypothetical protein
MKPRLSSKSPPATTVKLFPRLAPARFTPASVGVNRSSARVALAKVATPVPSERTQMRARLLRMILDNESARRHEHHPNAS